MLPKTTQDANQRVVPSAFAIPPNGTDLTAPPGVSEELGVPDEVGVDEVGVDKFLAGFIEIAAALSGSVYTKVIIPKGCRSPEP